MIPKIFSLVLNLIVIRGTRKVFTSIFLLLSLAIFFFSAVCSGHDTGVNISTGVIGEHPVHQYITKEAGDVWPDLPFELAFYLTKPIDAPVDVSCFANYDPNYDDIVTGSADEDQEWSPGCIFGSRYKRGYLEHFWDPDDPNFGGESVYDKGYSDDQIVLDLTGVDQFASSYNKAQFFWDRKVICHYTGHDKVGNTCAVDKDQAYYWLGRIAHLLEDLTVPAHVHNVPHNWASGILLDTATDPFEGYIGSVFSLFKGNNYKGKEYKYEDLPGLAIQQDFKWTYVHSNPTNLFKLFWYTAQKTQYYATGGTILARNGDIGAYRKLDETPTRFQPSLWEIEGIQPIATPDDVPTKLHKMAIALVPHALRAVAGLYRLFWMETHLSLTNGQVVSEDVNQNAWNFYTITVPSGVNDLTITTFKSSGDVDLYVRYNQTPTLSVYDCRPLSSSGDEVCTFSNPSAGIWIIGVRGYDAGIQVYELKAKYSATTVTTVDPEPASTIAATESFSWNEVQDATQYWVYLGTAQGKADIANGDVGSNTSLTIGNIPQDGSTVWLRIWYRVDDRWNGNDFSYTAGTSQCADGIDNDSDGLVDYPNDPDCTNASDNDETGTGATDTTVSTVTPAPASVIAATESFTWNNVTGATAYWAYLGTSVGSRDLFNSGSLSATQVAINNIPQDGSTLHLRIWYKIGSTWKFNDFTYTSGTSAGGGTGDAVQNLTPVSGSTLGITETFSWDRITNATEYWVYLGTTQGGRDIFSNTAGQSTSVTISSIPQDGSMVWLRVWYNIAGKWNSQDFSYTGGTTQPQCSDSIDNDGDGLIDFPNDPGCTDAQDNDETVTTITSVTPAPGSTLAATEIFDWNAVTGATEYWVYLGTAQGEHDLFNQSVGVNTSVIIFNIPQRGATVWLRLWYRVNGRWNWKEFSYTTGTGGSGSSGNMVAYTTFSVFNRTDSSPETGVAIGPTVSLFNTAQPGAINTSNRVHVNTGDGSNLNVRSTAGGPIVSQQPDGAQGTVIGNPVFADGFFWREVDFDTGPDGWVAEDFLEFTLPQIQRVYATFSVFNQTDPTPETGIAVGPAVSVFNAAEPDAITTGRVQVNTGDGSDLNVRDSAGGILLGQQPDGAFGTIIDGPIFADGFQWWRVDFDSGVDGWVAEDFLEFSPLPIQSAYVTFSVFNRTDPSGTIGLSVGPTVSVLNFAAPDALAGHVEGPVFSVENVSLATAQTMFQWPTGQSSADISQWFTAYNNNANHGTGGYHAGLDLVSTSTIVVAADAGTVRRIDNHRYANANHCMGNVVIIDHNNGSHSLYAHLASISVTDGQDVTKGAQIGVMGNTGSEGAACEAFPVHLHFEAKAWSAMGNLDDDLGRVWGYTQSGQDTTNRPNWYGYMNPFPYLEFTITDIPPTVIGVTVDNSPVRTGPDPSYTEYFATVSSGQKFVAFSTYNGWYQVYLPSEHGPATGWIQGVEDESAAILAVNDPARGLIGVSVRESPSAESNRITYVWDRQLLAMSDQAPISNGCDQTWYEIFLPDGLSSLWGWVCGEFLDAQ